LEKNMITYYGYTISPNQLETDEGFLICRNVPIARTGEQDYLGSELGLKTNDIVKVYRPEEEVFSDATIASFEGKPVTNDHPSELVDVETAGIYGKGHVQNVRRGVGEWKDYLVADLHIQDPDLINDIKSGKREVSCGYMTEYEDNGDGTFTQRNIRGNHVAVVTEGRAGHEAAIMDSIKKSGASPERKKMSKKTIFSTLFGHAAEGKTADEISKLMLDSAEAFEDEAPEAEDPKEEAKAEEPHDEDYSQKLFESIDALNGKIDRLCDALMPKEEEQKDEDPIETALKALESIEEKAEDPIDAEEAHVVPAENLDCNDAMDAATKKALLSAMRPVVAAIENEAQRKAVSDALIGALKTRKDDVAEVAKAMNANAQKSVSDGKKMDAEALQKIYDNLNPHRKEIK
jgi:hypothetical protein